MEDELNGRIDWMALAEKEKTANVADGTKANDDKANDDAESISIPSFPSLIQNAETRACNDGWSTVARAQLSCLMQENESVGSRMNVECPTLETNTR